MSWAVGHVRGRDVGYAVPASCDHPGCTEIIDRGLAYVCGEAPGVGEHGCGLFFCDTHRTYTYFGKGKEELPDTDDDAFAAVCARCAQQQPPFDPTPDVAEWIGWKLNDDSWEQWRQDNPAEVSRLRDLIRAG